MINTPRLLEWFDREGIAYPWGEDRSPYRVWISEVMLQQTVVTAVIPFFRRWMERFPTLEALAQTEEGEVLRYWEGLGYYSRARNILKTAKIINDEKQGRFPDSYEELTALPGIGDYTAGAILSISFGVPRPVLDANVKRICLRLEARSVWDMEADRIWREDLQKAIEDSGDPGRFNGALMQLGQLVCRSGNPACLFCPLADECRAREEGRAAAIPVKKRKVVVELSSQVAVFCREREGRISYWIVQRQEGIGRGLWTFPRFDEDYTPPADWQERGSLCVRTHNYTKYREKLMPRIWAEREGAELPPAAWREGEGFWATAGELAALAAPAVYRKIINELIER